MADVKVNIYEYAKRYGSRPATPRGGSISRLVRSITSRIMRSRYWQSPSDPAWREHKSLARSITSRIMRSRYWQSPRDPAWREHKSAGAKHNKSHYAKPILAVAQRPHHKEYSLRKLLRILGLLLTAKATAYGGLPNPDERFAFHEGFKNSYCASSAEDAHFKSL